jgi:hypothetical protein
VHDAVGVGGAPVVGITEHVDESRCQHEAFDLADEVEDLVHAFGEEEPHLSAGVQPRS